MNVRNYQKFIIKHIILADYIAGLANNAALCFLHVVSKTESVQCSVVLKLARELLKHWHILTSFIDGVSSYNLPYSFTR
jgi:hypothetical protein